MITKLKTKRLILRPWKESDAKNLYRYAKDPRVGPSAAWHAHTSEENSREIIKTVLSAEQTYAVTLKNGVAVGSIGLLIGEKSHIDIAADEAEIGYWIGVPYWGRGLIPEAAKELMRYAFEELHLKKLWCEYYDINQKSKRVAQKCGFEYVRTEEAKCPLTGETKIKHITAITKSEWEKKRRIIRLETPNDYEEVERLTYAAFKNMQGRQAGECDEHLLIHKMRFVPAFIPELSFVYELDGNIVGHIAYTKSKVIGKDGKQHEVATFGPLSVLPQHQKRGIGGALIKHTLQRARELGFKAVLITGHPDYYPKFGFVNAEKYKITMPDGSNIDAFMALELCDGALNGISGKWIYDSVFEIDRAELAKFNKKFGYGE